MAMKEFIEQVCLRAGNMTASERISRIRELVADSKEDLEFIQESFPELYREAFPPAKTAAGSSSGLRPPYALLAKR